MSEKLVLNDAIESVKGRWEFFRDAKTGEAKLQFWGTDGESLFSQPHEPSHEIPVTLEDMDDLRTLFPEMDKHLKSLEIERKYVLNKLPHAIPDDVIVMNQYYSTDDKPFRIRQSIGLASKMIHTRTEKTLVSEGVFIEDEVEISADEFQTLRAECNRVIRKTRFVYGIPGTDLRWEVDNYHDIKDLITAEIELPHIDYPFLTELYMEDVINKEVTGNPEYFNSNMATAYTHVDNNVEEEIVNAKSTHIGDNANS